MRLLAARLAVALSAIVPPAFGAELVRVRVSQFTGFESATLDSGSSPGLFTLDDRVASAQLTALNPAAQIKNPNGPGNWFPALTPILTGETTPAGFIELTITPQSDVSLTSGFIAFRTGARFASNPSSLNLTWDQETPQGPLATIDLSEPTSTCVALPALTSGTGFVFRWTAGNDFGENGGGESGFTQEDLVVADTGPCPTTTTTSTSTTTTSTIPAPCVGDQVKVFDLVGSTETFVVPQAAGDRFIIVAKGAAGSDYDTDKLGGGGAEIRGTFTLAPSQTLHVLVGGMGTDPGSGGGGSFVSRGPDLASSQPLVIAGGGGGAGRGTDATGGAGGVPGPPGPANGTAGGMGGSAGGNGGFGINPLEPPVPLQEAGVGGLGGMGGGGGCRLTNGAFGAGGGAGLSSNGRGGDLGGTSFIAGGLGGINTELQPPWLGGFGGGGAPGNCGGGGGGYGGGGAGGSGNFGNATQGAGGGGGSLNIGENQVNLACTNHGNGRVAICWDNPSVPTTTTTTPPTNPICGNGVVEAPEQCDGGECCSGCRLNLSNTPCGESPPACRVQSQCNGLSPVCPDPGFAPNASA